MPFVSEDISVGAGTLYWAPIGTAEPTTISGALPGGYLAIGYTDEGSSISIGTTTENVTVAESFYPLRIVVTEKTANMDFAMAEVNSTTLALSQNADPATAVIAGSGFVRFVPPSPGQEVRRMLVFDAEDRKQRWLFRRAFQTAQTEMAHRRGAEKTVLNVSFSAEKPTGVEPYEAWLAS